MQTRQRIGGLFSLVPTGLTFGLTICLGHPSEMKLGSPEDSPTLRQDRAKGWDNPMERIDQKGWASPLRRTAGAAVPTRTLEKPAQCAIMPRWCLGRCMKKIKGNITANKTARKKKASLYESIAACLCTMPQMAA